MAMPIVMSLWPNTALIREQFAARVCSMALKAPDSTLQYAPLGSIDLLRHQGSGLQQCERTRAHILDDGADFFFVCMPMHAHFGVCYRGIESRSHLKSFMFLGSRTPFRAYICENSPQGSFSADYIRVPGSLLRQHVSDIEDLCGHFISITPGIARAMQSSFQVALAESSFLKPEDSQCLGTSLTAIVCEVAAHALRESGGLWQRKSAAQITLARAKTIIEANLSNPDLTPAKVATECRVSIRYLNATFALNSDSVAHFIRESRLQHCRSALLNEKLVHNSVIELAASWGFNDPSHFSRLYKARFGVAPSVERAVASTSRAAERKPGPKTQSLPTKLIEHNEQPGCFAIR